MKTLTKTILLSLISIVLLGGLKVYALDYVPLEPIQQLGETANTKVDFASYVKGGFNLAIAIAAILAIIMITWGGIKYMTTEAVTSKGEAKKTINNALIGLLTALGAFVILLTINPDLTNFSLTAANIAKDNTPVTAAGTGPFYLVYSPTAVFTLKAVKVTKDGNGNTTNTVVTVGTYSTQADCNAGQLTLDQTYKNPICGWSQSGQLTALSFTKQSDCFVKMQSLANQNAYIPVKEPNSSSGYVTCSSVAPSGQVQVTPSTPN